MGGGGGSGHSSGFGGGQGYGGGYGQQSYGGYGQQPVYAQQPKKSGGMGGAGMLAAGKHSVFYSVSSIRFSRGFPYPQVPVLVCWEVCSSLTPSTVVSTTMVGTSVTSDLLGICLNVIRMRADFCPVPIIPTSSVTSSRIHPLGLSQTYPTTRRQQRSSILH